MSNQTILGVSAGTIIGIGSAVSPAGDLPSVGFLALLGVRTPASCLQWMKNQTEVLYLHPCFPVTHPPSLGVLSNIIVLISIFLIIWAGIEFIGKVQKT